MPLTTAERKRIRRQLLRWHAKIGNHIQRLCVDDYVFRTTMSAFQRAEFPANNHLIRWVQRCYESYALMGIRRLIDKSRRSKDTYSLHYMLAKLRKNPDIFSRRSYLAKWSGGMKHTGRAAWDALFGNTATHIPESLLDNDIATLEGVHVLLMGYPDQRIAHSQRNVRRWDRLQWDHIHQAIRSIEQVWLKYHLYFSLARKDTVMPTNTYLYDHAICHILKMPKQMIPRLWDNPR